jgi:hypothetical protein
VSEDNVMEGYPNVEIENGFLMVDYIVLDEQERARYLSMPKQINIINQLQTYTYSIVENTLEQSFSLKSMHYLVSEIIFVYRSNTALDRNNYFNYSNTEYTANKIK